MVDVGIVLLPEERWATQRHRWTAAEDMGFAHAWTYDHLAWRSLADGPWFATVPLLAAAAQVTSRLRLGTFVASPNFRHPVPFAKDVLGLDDVSGGRFLLGVGAGGEGVDAHVLGPAPTRAERTRRFGEFVGLLDDLLRDPVTDHAGEFYEAHGARMVPGSIARPRVPLWVAANGPRGMAVAAARGDAWVTYGTSFGPEESGDVDAAQERWWDGLTALSARVDEVEASVRGAGRAPLRRVLNADGGPRLALASADHAVEVVERAAALGFTDVVLHWPRAEGVYAGSEAELEAFAGRLGEVAGRG